MYCDSTTFLLIVSDLKMCWVRILSGNLTIVTHFMNAFLEISFCNLYKKSSYFFPEKLRKYESIIFCQSDMSFRSKKREILSDRNDSLIPLTTQLFSCPQLVTVQKCRRNFCSAVLLFVVVYYIKYFMSWACQSSSLPYLWLLLWDLRICLKMAKSCSTWKPKSS